MLVQLLLNAKRATVILQIVTNLRVLLKKLIAHSQVLHSVHWLRQKLLKQNQLLLIILVAVHTRAKQNLLLQTQETAHLKVHLNAHSLLQKLLKQNQLPLANQIAVQAKNNSTVKFFKEALPLRGAFLINNRDHISNTPMWNTHGIIAMR